MLLLHVAVAAGLGTRQHRHMFRRDQTRVCPNKTAQMNEHMKNARANTLKQWTVSTQGKSRQWKTYPHTAALKPNRNSMFFLAFAFLFATDCTGMPVRAFTMKPSLFHPNYLGTYATVPALCERLVFLPYKM